MRIRRIRAVSVHHLHVFHCVQISWKDFSVSSRNTKFLSIPFCFFWRSHWREVNYQLIFPFLLGWLQWFFQVLFVVLEEFRKKSAFPTGSRVLSACCCAICDKHNVRFWLTTSLPQFHSLKENHKCFESSGLIFKHQRWRGSMSNLYPTPCTGPPSLEILTFIILSSCCPFCVLLPWHWQ